MQIDVTSAAETVVLELLSPVIFLCLVCFELVCTVLQSRKGFLSVESSWKRSLTYLLYFPPAPY